MSTLYENIRFYCEKAGISGAKLCADAGVSKSTLTSLKNGRTKKINTDNLAKMASRLGVSVDDLLGYEQKEKPADCPVSGNIQEFIELFSRLSLEDQAREIAYLRERVNELNK